MERFKEFFKTNPFAYDGENNILGEEYLGITSDIASLITPERSATVLQCFQGCPYTSSKFGFDLRIDGEGVRASSWKWLPNAMLRRGESKRFSVETLTAMVPSTRAFVMKVKIQSKINEDDRVPVTLMYRGNARKDDNWVFYIPIDNEKTPRECYRQEENLLVASFETAAYVITSSLPMNIFPHAYMWESEITIPAKGELTVYFSGHIGEEEKVIKEAKAVNYEKLIANSFCYLQKETDRIYENLPRLTSDCPELDNLYYRSLVTYIMCRWENPDLCTVPYYSTGSVNGACMCSYLWDYCGGLMLHPVYDPEGNKKQLLAYLKNDLTKSYALNPVTSGPVGPWYQINQEKITMMVYHHIRATGDVDFLTEKVGDRSVLEWMKYHAYVCDDITRDLELYDYGEGGDDHLELKTHGNSPYDGIMPDLNARRYLNFMRAYELSVVAGEPDETLRDRAAQLKEKLKTLWNDEEKWYDFIDSKGNRDICYTVQMFKFLNSDVIGKYERDGLVSHLNEREFLSKFGLHSMSKLDRRYDQDDIDNGGGGICTHFTAHICAQLYQMGYDQNATDILRRVYWWGERLPYMGDSCAANIIANRESTPLQGDISSTAFAQMIFFFIFGITPHFDGKITVSPVRRRPAKNMRVENARLCGKTFSVDILDDTFSVCIGEEIKTAKIGETVTI